MGKEQELLQAVKSADLQTTTKLLSKLRTSRSSEYTPTRRLRPSPSAPTSGSRIGLPPLASLAGT